MQPNPQWKKLSDRLQAAGQSVRTGACIVKCTIVVIDGEPRLWMRPEVQPFEPYKDAALLGRLLVGGVGVVELSDEGEPK